MAPASRTHQGRDALISALDGFILALNIAKDACPIPPAQAVFGSVGTLLTTIRDTVVNQEDYVELGRVCADVCQVLDRGLNGKRLNELSRPVLDAIGMFTTTVAAMQSKVTEQGKRNPVSQFLHSKADKDKIAVWRQDLLRILQIFNIELTINAVVILGDLQRDREDASRRRRYTRPSVSLGELPPPAQRSCFGRDELIGEVVRLAENFKPIALIGAGGIGKTSIALSVLHHPRVKARFGDDRRFIRCDQFPASRAHLLTRLSEAIGAGVENPEDLTSLRPFLCSKRVFIILDNTESILDPQGSDARGIFAIVDELCQFETICVCITSRITMVPRHCSRPKIPTLSMEAARNIFYGIYGDRYGRSGVVDNLLRRLDFHALSITLLPTAAFHNTWSYNRLAEEWEAHQVQALRTDYNESLAATIELSLNCPTFRKLGPTARDLLGIVAFFPQGVDKGNLDWLFPTIPNRKDIFDKFGALSLTYRNNNFVTMLAPIRDYLRPKDPISFPLLSTTKHHYFTRLSARLHPSRPEFAGAQWIASEDMNVEHLVDVFTSVGTDLGNAWDACIGFLVHLCVYKPRETVLAQKIEHLPDSHRHKPRCLFELSQLFGRVGNHAKRRRLLTRALELWRGRGNVSRVINALRTLADANRRLHLWEEGIQQVKEALEICERYGEIGERMKCLEVHGLLLLGDNQLDAAQAVMLNAIGLIPEKGEEVLACKFHNHLGKIYRCKGDKKKAAHHLETALRVASNLNWGGGLSYIHHDLALLFQSEGRFDEANAHIKQAKLHTVHNTTQMGSVVETQAQVWRRQNRFGDAASEIRRAIEIYEKLGAATDAKRCTDLLQSWNRR